MVFKPAVIRVKKEIVSRGNCSVAVFNERIMSESFFGSVRVVIATGEDAYDAGKRE
jgi:hypothetical protein